MSVTCVLCDKTKQCTADILIPHQRAVALVFWHQHWLMSDDPCPLKFKLKWPIPFEKCQLQQISAYNVSTIRDSKKIQLWRMGSRSRAFEWAVDGVHTLPLNPPKGGSKSDFFFFKNKIQFQSNKVCYKVSLCEKLLRHSCGITISPYNGP